MFESTGKPSLVDLAMHAVAWLDDHAPLHSQGWHLARALALKIVELPVPEVVCKWEWLGDRWVIACNPEGLSTRIPSNASFCMFCGNPLVQQK